MTGLALGLETQTLTKSGFQARFSRRPRYECGTAWSTTSDGHLDASARLSTSRSPVSAFDVRIHAIRCRSGRRRPFEVRWHAGTAAKSKSF
jgi:hypothetical protein